MTGQPGSGHNHSMMGVPNYGATNAKAALELIGLLDNRRVRGPLAALDEAEVAAMRAGLAVPSHDVGGGLTR